jgi:hypothetical protein
MSLITLTVHTLQSKNATANAATTLNSKSKKKKKITSKKFKKKSVIKKSTFSNGPGPALDEKTGRPSQEWKKLGPQSWETITLPKPQDVDPHGIDKGSKIRRNLVYGYEQELVTANSEQIELGEISRSRSPREYLSLEDDVFIKAKNGLQVGTTYSLATPSVTIRSDGRKGYSYHLVGKVKIEGVQDNLFMGKITASYDMIERGFKVISLVNRVSQVKPVASPTEIRGELLLDKRISSFEVGQFKNVLINRGLSDGVAAGMIFRTFQYRDGYNKKSITDEDILPYADILVIHSSPEFSTGNILFSSGTFAEGSQLSVLTDVTKLKDRYGFSQRGDTELKVKAKELFTDKPGSAQIQPTIDDQDWLDLLDNGQNLGKKESQELNQLENYNTPQVDPTLIQDKPVPSAKPLESIMNDPTLISPAPSENHSTTVTPPPSDPVELTPTLITPSPDSLPVLTPPVPEPTETPVPQPSETPSPTPSPTESDSLPSFQTPDSAVEFTPPTTPSP